MNNNNENNNENSGLRAVSKSFNINEPLDDLQNLKAPDFNEEDKT